MSKPLSDYDEQAFYEREKKNDGRRKNYTIDEQNKKDFYVEKSAFMENIQITDGKIKKSMSKKKFF